MENDYQLPVTQIVPRQVNKRSIYRTRFFLTDVLFGGGFHIFFAAMASPTSYLCEIAYFLDHNVKRILTLIDME